MVPWNRLFTTVGGRRFIGGLGGLYAVTGLVFPVLPGVEPISQRIHLIIALIAMGPGLVLLIGSYWLPRTSIRHEYYSNVARWCVGGLLITFSLVVLTELAADTPNLAANVLILTALGSTAGFIAGTYNARAMSRERDLEETVEQLQTTNERLEQFAYAASHDLQEPMRMVSSYLQLIEQRYEDDLDEDGKEFIGFAVSGADRMRAMVDSLLEYSHVMDNQVPLEPTDTEQIFDGACENLRIPINETNATVTTDDLPTVQADGRQLTTVFQNLLANALNFSGEEPPRVHIGAERRENSWEFSVADEGIGIDPQFHSQIFEVFNQLHRNEELETNSVGIGLAVSEQIIGHHGGEMWVDSEVGEGATFYFTLPTVPDEQSVVSPQVSGTV